MKKSMITVVALALAVCVNAQEKEGAATGMTCTAMTKSDVPSTALAERFKNELGLDKNQAEAARNILLSADKETSDLRTAADEIMRRLDEAYAKHWDEVRSTMSPEQAQRFDELRAGGALNRVYCTGCCPAAHAAEHKEGCCAGDKAAPSGGTVNGKAVAAPRPTKQPKRTGEQ